MNAKTVGILGLVVVAAALFIWMSQNDVETNQAGEVLLSGLAQELDDVSELALANAAGDTVTIEQTNGQWTVREKSRFYANSKMVGNLLVAAADATVSEAKTSNPELYDQIGVQDLSQDDSRAVKLSITAPSKTYELLIGNQSGRFGGSTFVRRAGEAESFLVTPMLSAEVNVPLWLQTSVLDIDAADVQSVQIQATNGEVVTISKSARGDAFVLDGMPEGRALSDVPVRGLGRGLTGLTFQNVTRAVAFPVNAYQRMSAVYTLFNGVVIEVILFYTEPVDSDDGPTKEPQYWLSIGSRFDAAIATEFTPQPSDENAQPFVLTDADLADRQQEADDIKNRNGPWVYEITGARFDSINRTQESLLIAVE
ncbi:MAG: DUF4340 domain-containing protein [Pseudomonadota bacterium]